MKAIVGGGQFNIDDHAYRVWGDDDNRSVYREILVRTYEQMTSMLSYHSRIIVIRFEFRVNDYTPCNSLVSWFFRTLVKQLKKAYKLKRVGYIWCREQNLSERQHYHCGLMLDANKVN